jgi:DNA-binding Xre family transcriptional regulator|tara:strand:- start:17844 stop:18215 length:372 start_codon:yes stop_codon:yes gene_type:complete
METKLKKLLKKRNISQKKLYDKIAKIYETPIGQYALSEIVNGKKLNYHIITLVKICNVLKVKPQSIVESDSLDLQLLKPEYLKGLEKRTDTSWQDEILEKHKNEPLTNVFTDESSLEEQDKLI